MRTETFRRFQFSELSGSQNGRDLFTELLVLYKFLLNPSFTESSPLFTEKKSFLTNARETPAPPHTSQTYEQKSGENMTPDASK